MSDIFCTFVLDLRSNNHSYDSSGTTNVGLSAGDIKLAG